MKWFLLFVIYLVCLDQWRKYKARKASADAAEEPLDNPGWNDDDVAYLPSSPRPIQATLKITYQKSNGVATERLVDVKECDTTNPAGYLIGFCHLRDSIRTFRMDRIKKCVDVETGELVSSLTDFALGKYKESPAASLEAMLDESVDVLRALIYIAKADGRFSAKEKQIFLAHCQRMAGDDRITLTQLEKAVKYMPSTTLQSYKLICGRLAKLSNEFKQEVLATTELMIATEKTVSDAEAEALAYMKKRFAVS